MFHYFINLYVGTLTTVALGVGQKLFDFDEHQKFLQKFHSSPGAPSLRQRPMFQMTDQKTNDEVRFSSQILYILNI